MRLMIIGHLNGYIGTAGKIALQRGAKVVHCEDVEEALGALRNGRGADLAMIDVKQPIGEFVMALEAERIHLPVVACGVASDTRAAVKAIQDGAKEYVPLPPDTDMIAALFAAVSEEQKTMIADDPAMKDVLKLAERVSPSDATILITGESGTGKEVMSRFVHNKSKRKDGNFVAVNCAAIPDNLLESELFGHEKGAFTGAVSRRIGKFEEAHGGTLLLDEISEMQPQLQAKLLRAIQEKEITRVGSNEPVKVDVRILATSNRNMEQSVKNGDFREDLYFRLSVVTLRLPSLRERPSDIVKLAGFFADKYADANGVSKKSISKDAVDLLTRHSWRGNIRELENTMHRAILMAIGDEIDAEAIMLDRSFEDDIEPPLHPAATKDTEESQQKTIKSLQNPGAVEAMIGRTVADVERDLIINTLEHCLGNRTHAANILGISIRTLRNKLNQYKDEGVDLPASATS